ncbi:GspH/FimT family pseudopilin [Neisseriaceae bacterium TC5R-5]|nr:GspH/FimT family pseudopilin [Neisseriaceae bacterium TC5R-5]
MGPQQGFTLSEMLITLAVLSLLLALAAPSLNRLLLAQKLRQHAQALSSSIQLARSEALHSQRHVYICAANLKRNLQIQGCAPSKGGEMQSWDEGALVYADKEGGLSAAYDSQERLHLLPFAQEHIQIRAASTQLILSPEGRLADGQSQQFYLSSPNSRQCLELTIAGHGRSQLGEVRDDCA